MVELDTHGQIGTMHLGLRLLGSEVGPKAHCVMSHGAIIRPSLLFCLSLLQSVLGLLGLTAICSLNYPVESCDQTISHPQVRLGEIFAALAESIHHRYNNVLFYSTVDLRQTSRYTMNSGNLAYCVSCSESICLNLIC